jgi:hypothetical protein
VNRVALFEFVDERDGDSSLTPKGAELHAAFDGSHEWRLKWMGEG